MLSMRLSNVRSHHQVHHLGHREVVDHHPEDWDLVGQNEYEQGLVINQWWLVTDQYQLGEKFGLCIGCQHESKT